MALQIHFRRADGIIILDLAGALTLGPGHERLRDEVTSLERAGLNKIVVNLRGVSKIDAAGLGALTLVLMSCRTSGGRAVLSNLAKIDTSDALELDTEFETFQDERDAINSFFPDRAINHYDILTFVEQEIARKEDR